MKKLGIAVIGIAVLAVGSVFGTAYIGKSRLVQASDEAFGPLKGKDGIVRVLDYGYQGNLLSGDHTVKLGLGCAADASAASTLTIRSHVKYGPLLSGGHFGASQIDTTLELPDATRKELAKLIGEQEPLRLTTRVSYGNSIESEMVVPAFKTPQDDKGSVSWAGLTSNWQYDPATRIVRSSFSMPELRYDRSDDKTQYMVIRGISGSSDSQYRAGQSWWLPESGSAEAKAELIEMGLGAERGKMSLSKLHYSGKNQISNDLLSSKVSFSAAGKFGELVIESLELNESVKGVHAPTLVKIITQMLDGKGLCGATQGSEQAAVQVLSDTKMQPLLTELLRHDMEYGVDKLALQIDGKRGEVSYRFAIGGIKGEEKDSAPADLLRQHLKFTSKAALPLGWIDSAIKLSGDKGDPEEMRKVFMSMIDASAEQGLIVKDKDFVRAEFTMNPDGMQLNGKPFTPDAFVKAGMMGEGH